MTSFAPPTPSSATRTSTRWGETTALTQIVLAALGVLETDTAFRIARWSGLGLIGFYGWVAGRLAGQRPAVCVLQGLAVAALGGLLIVVKALIH